MSVDLHKFLCDVNGSFTETAPRPPVPGEENDRQSSGGMSNRSSSSHKSHVSGKSHSSGKSGISHRSDVSHSPAATPRRSNLDKTIVPNVSSETKLVDEAPLGFEPEGSAASSPQYTENCTPPYLKWAENLAFLLKDREGVRLFKEYLDTEHCSNTLDFWFACEGLKLLAKDDKIGIKKLVTLIFKKYIRGEKLNLRPEIKSTIVEKLKKNEDINQVLFDEAQTAIQNSMQRDTYPLFLKSDLYVQYVQTGGESPKTSNNSSGCNSVRPCSGPLPTLIEDEELKQEDIKESSAPVLAPLTRLNLVATSNIRVEQSLGTGRIEGCSKKIPVTRPRKNPSKYDGIYPNRSLVPHPYYVADSDYVPVSGQETELQSLSSDAVTDDTISLTDSSVDGRDAYSGKKWKKHHVKAMHRNAHFNRQTGLSNQPFIPRTDRAPKDPNIAETNPEKFAAMLIDRLEKVKDEQDKIERVKESMKSMDMTEEPDTSRSFQSSKVVNSATPLSTLLAAAMTEQRELVDDNAESILDGHICVWDGSNKHTPSRSPGRHSPRAWSPNRSLRTHGVAPRPSPNVSGNVSSLYPKVPKVPNYRKKEREPGYYNSVSSFDSGVGDDKSGIHCESDHLHHRHVYHHHHHHHHLSSKDKSRGVPIDSSLQHRSLNYFLSDPNLKTPVMKTRDDSLTRGRPKDSKRSSSRKGAADSCSIIDSGVSLVYDNAMPGQVPNVHDPANEKVLAWMMDNDKISTGPTQYSTDNSDKASSNKRPHKSTSPAQHKSSSSSSSKKPIQYNATRLGSLDRSGVHSLMQEDYYQQGAVQPNQPFVQDPSMPLMTPPNPTTQLEEAKRRLEDESKPSRITKSKSFTGTPASSSSSKDRRMMPPPCHTLPPRSLVTGKHVQTAPLDLSSSEDHSSSSSKSEKKLSRRQSSSTPVTPMQQDSTVVGYYFCDEPIPYRSTLPGKFITLSQFKQLVTKKGNYRYYFKKASDEFDTGVVQELVMDDNAVLPLWEGKIFGKVEKLD